mmetsp:Transcript_12807/g.19061  ORF Transcript_12807/g.19061 Transcript_12807/m.19061 type:complete len:132 (-) Transcript_12807:116-511(-)
MKMRWIWKKMMSPLVAWMTGKMLRNVFNHFPLHDIRSTLACVNSKWRETALDATPSPDDYLTTLEEDRIPCAIEFLGQQKEKVSGLNSIETHGGVEYIIKVFAGDWRRGYTKGSRRYLANAINQLHSTKMG